MRDCRKQRNTTGSASRARRRSKKKKRGHAGVITNKLHGCPKHGAPPTSPPARPARSICVPRIDSPKVLSSFRPPLPLPPLRVAPYWSGTRRGAAPTPWAVHHTLGVSLLHARPVPASSARSRRLFNKKKKRLLFLLYFQTRSTQWFLLLRKCARQRREFREEARCMFAHLCCTGPRY